LRLPNYDYTANGAYFVTLCTHKRNCYFRDEVFTPAGHMIGEVFEEVMRHYAPVRSPKYVVMPNHFHALIEVDHANGNATTSDII